MWRLVIPIFVSFWAAELEAATISVASSESPALVIVKGELELSDAASFRTTVASLPKAIILLEGPGGNLIAGMAIGNIIRQRNFITFVDTVCASACALAWLGGTGRFVSKDALIGFHAAYRKSDGGESGQANALVGKYLGDLGLSYDAIAYITSASPRSMEWMTKAEAAAKGIEMSIYDPAAKEADTTEQQLSKRAGDFLNQLYTAVNANNNVGFTFLGSVYADTVNYFGETLTRDQTYEKVTRFFERWPDREYRPRKETVKINCTVRTLACSLNGILEFSAKSMERNEHSAGTATFEFDITFANAKGQPKVTKEGGAVLASTKVPILAGTPAPAPPQRIRRDWHGKD